jgi:hypothetical protein
MRRDGPKTTCASILEGHWRVQLTRHTSLMTITAVVSMQRVWWTPFDEIVNICDRRNNRYRLLALALPSEISESYSYT